MSLVLRLLCTLVPTASLQLLLQATGPIAFFYGILVLGCFLPLLPSPYKKATGIIFFSFGACVGFTLIVIQPLAGFLVWFDLVPQRTMRGPVSLAFMYLGGFLSLIAVYGIGRGHWFDSLLRLLFVHALLAYIVFPSNWVLLLAGFLFPALIVSAVYCKPSPNHRLRGFASLAGLGMLAGLITIVSAPGQDPSGIFLIDNYNSKFLRTAVLKVMPDFPLLNGFSGYGHGFSEDKLGDKPLLSEQALFAVEGRAG